MLYILTLSSVGSDLGEGSWSDSYSAPQTRVPSGGGCFAPAADSGLTVPTPLSTGLFAPAAAPAARAKILIVDDVQANRVLMRHTLPPDEVDVIDASTGIEALAACRQHEFALILLDVYMPRMDGFELAAALSADPKTRDIPIIFVTAAGDDMARIKGYTFGAVDYMTKPLDEHVLASKLRVFVDLWRSKRQLHELLGVLEERNRKLEEEVAERRRIETLVRHQAQHDALTSLPNRILFLDRLDTALERATRHNERFALLYIDINGFKPVNDTHGHLIGDELLREISRRLSRNVRKTDTVARLGGDEFAIILEEVTQDSAALQVGEKIGAALAQPYTLAIFDEPIIIHISASVGVAIFPQHGKERNDLINAADAAMYCAKRSRQNQPALAQVPSTANQPLFEWQAANAR